MKLGFMFATGIENSNPTIQNGKLRMDEFEKCGHYVHYKKDLQFVKELGIEVRADAIFIQSESSEYYHAESPKAIKRAELMNARRFLSFWSP